MNTVFWKDLAERAGKSFGQGFVAVLLLNVTVLANSPLDWSNWKSVGVAAIGGGITALGSLGTSLISKVKTGTASASTVVAETSVITGRHAAVEDEQ